MSFLEFSGALRRAFRAQGGCQIVYAEVASTHRVGRRIVDELVAESSDVPPVDIYAWSQQAGQGRQERPWQSPAGQGVYLTLVRVADLPLQRLPLLVAVALAETLNPHLGGRCRLKWPNDLLVEDRKLGGILIDVKSRAGEPPVSIISFGVNVGVSPELGKLAATAIAEWGEALEPAALAIELAAAVDALLAAPPDDLTERYRRLSAHLPGQELRVRLQEGDLTGRFLGIDDAGFLRLEVNGQERLLVAGELHG